MYTTVVTKLGKGSKFDLLNPVTESIVSNAPLDTLNMIFCSNKQDLSVGEHSDQSSGDDQQI